MDKAVKHVLVLVHGIRTRAPWQITLQNAAQSANFRVVLTNYEYYDAIRLLLPVPYFRNAAVNRVWRLVRDTRVRYPKAQLSFLAHSFGSYIVAEILKREFDFKAHRIVFCGSIVKYDFPFDEVAGKFTSPLINEVGSRDPFPALAESVTWGYGSSGTFGFRNPRVTDRWHELSHSDFMTPEFFAAFWRPFFEHGVERPADAVPTPPPLWIRFISVFKLRWLLLAGAMLAIAYFALREGMKSYTITAADGVGYLASPIRSIVASLEEPCTRFAPLEYLRQRRCAGVLRLEDDVEKIVACKPFAWSGRDPYNALQALARTYEGCLVVTTSPGNRVSVGINCSSTEEFRTGDGTVFRLCRCPSAAREVLQKRHGAKDH